MDDAHFSALARRRKIAQFRAERSSGPKVIWLDRAIGVDAGELSARWLRSQLPTDGSEITLQVHCEGGSVFECLAMCDVLTAYNGKVKAIVSTMALSAASLLLTAADDVHVTSNAYLMLHNSHMNHVVLSPTESALLGNLNERMVAMYAARSKRPASEIRRMMNSETFLDASESVRLGFADRLVTASNLRIVARAIPKRIVAKLKTPALSATARWNTAVLASGSVSLANRKHPGLRLKMLAEVNSKR